MLAPLWQPSAERIARARITYFQKALEEQLGVHFADYEALWRWSVENPEVFWQKFWDFAGIKAEGTQEPVLRHGDKMPGAEWFPNIRLNYAEHLLQRRDDGVAIIFWGEDRVKRSLSFAELYQQVSQVAQALKAKGVGVGDRVAGYLPNMPEAIIAMLATASLGAIWSSASPDFGAQGVLDRFGQIEPKVLFTSDGYFYNGKHIEILDKVEALATQLPSLEALVVVPYLATTLEEPLHLGRLQKVVTHATDWQSFVDAWRPRMLDFVRVPFAAPLFILYSSGTTGVPKCIVHGTGGTLLQHLKEHILHGDLHAEDRLFYFTTCGWMMWNWLASGLAVGATILLYDGSPFVGRGRVLWEYAELEGVTHFGTSAKYIDAIKKIGLVPRKDYQLTPLRAIFSTGSPLAPESFDYVYQCIKSDLCLSSISGGTDIVSCFALGNPILPVWRGELQCRGLGMSVEVFNEEGRPVEQEKGELVCTKPFPVMPIAFWNDPDGSKYRAAYFERFPGIWSHGDYVELTAHHGLIIYGRSDAVLNPGGVRIGTAEIYRQVEQLPEVVESLVIGQEWDNDVRVVLFVRLQEGVTLSEPLIDQIKRQIRENTTPRHVPAKVIAVQDIPRTRSGKMVELAVRQVVHGQPVKNIEALANPESLEYFRNLAELKS